MLAVAPEQAAGSVRRPPRECHATTADCNHPSGSRAGFRPGTTSKIAILPIAGEFRGGDTQISDNGTFVPSNRASRPCSARVSAWFADPVQNRNLAQVPADRSMSMSQFFGYLHDHSATTELAKALADVTMLRTCGAAPIARVPAPRARRELSTGADPPTLEVTRRRDAIDVARILALALVVAGHLAMAVIDRGRHGGIRGTNLILLYPRWAVVAAIAPMPVFFAAGGWANATTSPRRAAPRLRTLIGLAFAVVGCWALAVLVAAALRGGDPGVVGQGARLATQPLWFLAAYLPLAFWGRSLGRAAAAHPVVAIGGCVLLAGALDVIRFGLDGPRWPAWLGFYLAWATPWLVGAWWRDRWTRDAISEPRVGAALFVGAALVGWLLVARAGYQASLIDYGSDGRSNTNPPTMYTAVVGLAQVGILMLVANGLDRVGARFRGFWNRAGSAAIGVYAWHLTALSLCVAVVAIPGMPAPRRLSAAWWYSRPLWYTAVLATCAALVGLTAFVQGRLGAHTRVSPARPAGLSRLTIGVVAAAGGGAVIGLLGPNTVLRAIVCVVLLGGGWMLLGPAPRWASGRNRSISGGVGAGAGSATGAQPSSTRSARRGH